MPSASSSQSQSRACLPLRASVVFARSLFCGRRALLRVVFVASHSLRGRPGSPSPTTTTTCPWVRFAPCAALFAKLCNLLFRGSDLFSFWLQPPRGRRLRRARGACRSAAAAPARPPRPARAERFVQKSPSARVLSLSARRSPSPYAILPYAAIPLPAQLMMVVMCCVLCACRVSLFVRSLRRRPRAVRPPAPAAPRAPAPRPSDPPAAPPPRNPRNLVRARSCVCV